MAPIDFALLLLGGFLGEEVLLTLEWAAGSKLIISADSGAEHARKLSLPVNAIIGDLDSISPETLRFFEELRNPRCEIIKVSDQEHNDFEKALSYLSERWNGSVRILGMTGGRTDHTLSNLSVMLRYSDKFSSIEAFDGEFVHSFLTTKNNHRSIECPIGTTISLMPFGEAVGVTTKNLQYPLTSETLRLGQREGLSNISTASPVSISIESGALLISVKQQ
jgi:thiamine pyrophosphokinase